MVDRMDKTFLTLLKLVACWLLKLPATCEAGLRRAVKSLRRREVAISYRLPVQWNILSAFARLHWAAPWGDDLPPPGRMRSIAVRAVSPAGPPRARSLRRARRSRLRH